MPGCTSRLRCAVVCRVRCRLPVPEAREGRLPHRGRLVGRKGGEFRGRHIAQIAGQIHDLVIAEHQVDAAAGGRGLGLQPHDQVERPARFRAPIEDVAVDYEMGRAAAPGSGFVDQTSKDKLEFLNGLKQ